ncbi:CarD family transcriptional regulator [Clostridium sp.]|uniref:CarD family transcriptional regulator n=1 Tax=Clostridium sp. TaxID=1506 RepID=UPI003F2A389C
MFNLGDTVVYPCQGIGIIDSIEEREFKGEKQDYYSISIINNTMKLTVPVSRIDVANIRLMSNSNAIDKSLEDISSFITNKDELEKSSTNERMAINSKKMKLGKLEDYLGMVYDLNKVKTESKLNSTENQFYQNIRACVIDEMCQSKNIAKDEANRLLDDAIK